MRSCGYLAATPKSLALSGGAADVVSDIWALERSGFSVTQFSYDSRGLWDRWGCTPPSEQLESFDILVCSGFMAVERVFDFYPNLKPRNLILNVKDLHFLREKRCQDVTGLRRSWPVIMRREIGAVKRCNCVLSYSQVEVDLLKGLCPESNVKLHSFSRPDFTSRVKRSARKCVFLGNFQHLPNVDAVRWLANDLYAAFYEFNVSVELYGRGSSLLGKALAERRPHIRVMGEVADLDCVFEDGGYFVAPLRFGAGIKIKLVEAALAGMPIIATPVALEGLPFDDSAVSVFNDRHSFMEAMGGLLNEPQIATEKAKIAARTARRFFNETMVVKSFSEVFRQSRFLF